MGLTEFSVPGSAAIGQIRRNLRTLAADSGFSAEQISELEIVTTELATNLVKNNAVDGSILLQTSPKGESPWIEMASVDFGPGIADVEAAKHDHYSTCDTSGFGLGAISRLMDQFDVFSRVADRTGNRMQRNQAKSIGHAGTIVTCRKWAGSPPEKALECCTLSTPFPGETSNGDGYLIKQEATFTLVALVDGAGHGNYAEEASQRALHFIDKNSDAPLDDILLSLHEQLRDTRGAVATLVRLDRAKQKMQHSGVGNVVTRTYPKEKSGLLTQPGLLGSGQLTRPPVQIADWPEGSVILVCTDGISDGWSLENLLLSRTRSVSTMAHYIMSRHRLQTDDATILALRDLSGA